MKLFKRRHPCMRRKSGLRLWLMEHLPRRTSGLGKPISEAPHYIVRVYYGGYWCEESLEGPYATSDEAAAVRREHWAKGCGAVVYRCTSIQSSSLASLAPQLRPQ